LVPKILEWLNISTADFTVLKIFFGIWVRLIFRAVSVPADAGLFRVEGREVIKDGACDPLVIGSISGFEFARVDGMGRVSA